MVRNSVADYAVWIYPDDRGESGVLSSDLHGELWVSRTPSFLKRMHLCYFRSKSEHKCNGKPQGCYAANPKPQIEILVG